MGPGMRRISYARHRSPPAIVQHAVWLYLRVALSCRDVADLLAERSINVSYEAVRRWKLQFGAAYAQRSGERGPLWASVGQSAGPRRRAPSAAAS